MSAPLVVNTESHDGPWTLSHRVAGGYCEPEYDATTGRVVALRTWADTTKAVTWREVLLDYDGVGRLSSVVEKQYDSSGALLATRSRSVIFDPTSGVLASIDG